MSSPAWAVARYWRSCRSTRVRRGAACRPLGSHAHLHAPVVCSIGSSVPAVALPPILNFGSDYLKNLVARDVVTGKKNICLAISEPLAGSDVANIQTSAEKTGDGWVVNGTKKWITGGAMGDFFTTLVRTGGPDSGPAGLSLLLLERGMKGIEIRKMPTQFDSAHSTTMISLHNVHVPARNLIGEEGAGFMYILHNFNVSCTLRAFRTGVLGASHQ